MPYGFANPHGRVFDYWGNDIITDATGNDIVFRPRHSVGISTAARTHRHEAILESPVSPDSPARRSSASRSFSRRLAGRFPRLQCDQLSGHLPVRKSREDGSGLKGETIPEHLLSADIAANPNFRPSGVAVPPGWLALRDGLVADAHRPFAASPARSEPRPRPWPHLPHHLPRRVRFCSRKRSPANPSRTLLDLLKEHEDNVRQRAEDRTRYARHAKVIAAVQKWEKALSKKEATYEHNRLEALWVHQWHNIVNLDLLNDVLKSPEPRACAQAVRVL